MVLSLRSKYASNFKPMFVCPLFLEQKQHFYVIDHVLSDKGLSPPSSHTGCGTITREKKYAWAVNILSSLSKH